MNRKSLVYSGVLLIALIVTSILFNRGVIHGVDAAGEVGLALNPPAVGNDVPEYLLGQTVRFTGTLLLPNETSTITSVTLAIVDGPQTISVALPVVEVTDYDLSAATTPTEDKLIVTVTHTDIEAASGTLPSTVPATLPGAATEIAGTSAGAKLTYDILWTPPVFLDPAPTFALITNPLNAFDVLYSIPYLVEPSSLVGVELPNVEDVYTTIPVPNAPSGTALPDADYVFDVPAVTLSSNAHPTTAADPLPDVFFDTANTIGFTAPLVPVAEGPSGVPSLPDTTDYVVIPSPSLASAPGAQEDFPTITSLATVTSSNPRGLAFDGTDFWIISNGTGTGGVDELIRVTTAGVERESVDGPSSKLEGVAYLDSTIYLLENEFRCHDQVEPNSCHRQHRIFVVDPDSLPSGSEDSWAALDTINAPDNQIELTSMSSDATNSSLWMGAKWGDRFFNIDTDGEAIDDDWINVNGGQSDFDAIAYNDDIVYSSDGSEVVSWTKDGTLISTLDVDPAAPNIRGMTFGSGTTANILYMASSDGDIYETFVGESVASPIMPRGIAFAPAAAAGVDTLFVVVDGSPSDFVIRVKASDGSAVTSFGGGDGAASAPDNNVSGITFLDDTIYLISNQGNNAPPKLHKMNLSGVVVRSYDLGNTAFIFNSLGGLTNNGTDLIAFSQSQFSDAYFIDPSDGSSSQTYFAPGSSINGATSLAYNSGRETFYAAKNDGIVSFDAEFNSTLADNSMTLDAGGFPGDVQGLTFNSDTLYIVHEGAGGQAGRIARGYLGDSATQLVRGIAHSASGSDGGESLWMIIDGSPYDKLVKANTSTGLLKTDFGDDVDEDGAKDGVVDAPSDATVGIAYLNDFIYVVANEPMSGGGCCGVEPKIWKINPQTGAVVAGGTINLQQLNIHENIGGMTDNGTNLLVYSQNFDFIVEINPETSQMVGGEKFPFTQAMGGNGFAYHAGRAVYVVANNNTLSTLDSNLQNEVSNATMDVNGVAMSGNVQGMTFDSDVLFIAEAVTTSGSRIVIGAMADTVTQDPTGVAYAPTGSQLLGVSGGGSIAEGLFIIVDGTPADYIVKANASTGALLTDFSTDGGHAGPSSEIDGVAFLDGYLYLIGLDTTDQMNQRLTLWKLKGTDGAIVETYDLSMQVPMHDRPGGMSTDGTNLIIASRTESRYRVFSTGGGSLGEKMIQGQSPLSMNGAQGLAYRALGSEYFAGVSMGGGQSTIAQTFQGMGQDLEVVRDFDVDGAGAGVGVGGINLIKGMTFGANDTLYIAQGGTDNGEIYTASVPSDVTSGPLGLAYDGDNTELYILLDGQGKADDNVIVVNSSIATTSPAIVRSFKVGSENATSITFMDGELFVGRQSSGGCFNCGGNYGISVLEPTGVVVREFDLWSINSAPSGLTNNGENLLIVQQQAFGFGGGEAIVIEPTGGQEVGRQFFFSESDFNFTLGNLSAMAYSSVLESFLPVDNTDTVYLFDEEGRLVTGFDVGINGPTNGLQGAVVIGNYIYLAENSNSDRIVRALIPTPTVEISNDPFGMAAGEDGSLYIGVEATPTDRILKTTATSTDEGVTSAAVDTAFGGVSGVEVPGSEAGALAVHDGKIYVVTNDIRGFDPDDDGPKPFVTRSFVAIFVFDATTGAMINKMPIFAAPMQWDPEQIPMLQTPIEAMTSDGQFLYLGSGGYDEFGINQGMTRRWFKFDPNNPFNPAYEVMEVTGGFVPVEGFGAFEYLDGSQFSEEAGKLAAFGWSETMTYNIFARFDQYGQMTQRVDLGESANITGASYVGRTLFMADDPVGDNNGRILGTALPENTIELTTVSMTSTAVTSTPYTATFTAVGTDESEAAYSITDTSAGEDPVEFHIVRNDELSVQLTGLSNPFVVTSSDSVLAGRLTDPSILQAEVGVQLPFFASVDDSVVRGTSEDIWSESGLWHLACEDDAPFLEGMSVSGACAWRYGTANQPDYDTGGVNSGALTLNDPFEVSENTVLRFKTWYNTEAHPEGDAKVISIATVTKDAGDQDIVGNWQTYAQIVGPGFQWDPPPQGSHPAFQYIERQPADRAGGGPRFTEVEIGLGEFTGQRLLIKFGFDTKSQFANVGEGWFIDDIVVDGAATRTILVATTAIDGGPVTVASTTYYREFSTPFDLAEGQNVVVARVIQSYSPFLVATDSISGNVDTNPPLVSLAFQNQEAGQLVTNALAQTIYGAVLDDTFALLEVRHTKPGSGEVVTVYSTGQLPEDGVFSVPVQLEEGLNTFTAVGTDSGGKTATATVLAVGDTTAPSVEDEGVIHVVGVVASRQNDEFIIQVTVDDGTGEVSGVDRIEVTGAATVGSASIDDVPAVIANMYQITGNQLAFGVVPSNQVSDLQLSVTAFDNAGNVSEPLPISVSVVPSLVSQRIFLFGGSNLIGINLQGTGGSVDFSVYEFLAQELDIDSLDQVFASTLSSALLTSTVAVSQNDRSITLNVGAGDSNVNDRLVIGSGDTSLTTPAPPNSTVITVESTTGFSAGQVIQLGGRRGPFGLGFDGGETSTVLAVLDGSTLGVTTTTIPLLIGDQVTGVEEALVSGINNADVSLASSLKLGSPAAGTPVVEEAKLGDIVTGIFHFTGGLSDGGSLDASNPNGIYQQYIKGVGGDLTALKQGRGYWVIANEAAFSRIQTGAGDQIVVPVGARLDGVLFDAFGTPPSLPATNRLVKIGWHQIALISEKPLVVDRGLRGLTSVNTGNPLFTSLVEFQRFVDFDAATGVLEVRNGVLNPLFAGVSDVMGTPNGFFVKTLVANTEVTP